MKPSPVRIGISACLLGEEVRFDGGHKRADVVLETLGRVFEFVAVCPEVEMGLGTPRETLRLVRDGSLLRMVTTTTNIDHTEAMNRWAAQRVEELAAEDLSGFVLKKDSPSCGIDGVKTYGDGPPVRDGRGLFATALMKRFPRMPVANEERLADTAFREDFIQRVLLYRRTARLPQDV